MCSTSFSFQGYKFVISLKDTPSMQKILWVDFIWLVRCNSLQRCSSSTKLASFLLSRQVQLIDLRLLVTTLLLLWAIVTHFFNSLFGSVPAVFLISSFLCLQKISKWVVPVEIQPSSCDVSAREWQQGMPRVGPEESRSDHLPSSKYLGLTIYHPDWRSPWEGETSLNLPIVPSLSDVLKHLLPSKLETSKRCKRWPLPKELPALSFVLTLALLSMARHKQSQLLCIMHKASPFAKNFNLYRVSWSLSLVPARKLVSNLIIGCSYDGRFVWVLDDMS